MRRFALIRGNLRNRGELIGDPDIMIAATGLHHNLTLVTRNVRHFERIAGLPLYQ
jgi:predicted nucleic acid-binding protein